MVLHGLLEEQVVDGRRCIDPIDGIPPEHF